VSIREKRLAQAAITTSDVTIYTCPEKYVTTLKTIDVANTSGSSVAVTVNLVPSGDAAAAANALIAEMILVPGAALQWTGTQVLEAGDFLSVIADAAGATLTVSGVERNL
jgi:hypothetical protein